MLNTAKLLSELALIGLLSIASLKSSYGQNEINLSTGFGLPELFNIGIRGQFGQNVIGISVGTLPGLPEGEKTFSVCGDLFCHFGKVPELSKRCVWYARGGFNYLSAINNDGEDRYTYLNLRFGRDLNLSKKIGIQVDAGGLIEISRKSIPETWLSDLLPQVLPSLGLNFFVQL